MIDDNLPTFYYKESPEGVQHHTAIYLSQRGSDPEATYVIKHADPSTPTSRNCYAVALFDSYNPDVLYGEVLVRPGWTLPTLSQEELRRNGGVPPPPAPVLPTDFTIQLYNPDQQVTVIQKPGSWGGSASYEFLMPQTSFRMPSASTLDRTHNDPAASLTTPKLNFVWRREGKLTKDMTCFLSGKSTDTITKKKNRDPDIAIALFRSQRELTVYEPNLYRVDMEDPKGLEVVLLLAASTIKDVFFNTNMRDVFNVDDAATGRMNSGGRKLSSPHPVAGASPAMNGPSEAFAAPNRRTFKPQSHTAPQNTTSRPPPPVDARAQWELDAETARLRTQMQAEEREQKRQEAARRREREKADEAETRRLRQMVEAEQKEARQRQEAIDRETERLKRQYGAQTLPQLPTRPASGPSRINSGSQPLQAQPGPSTPQRGSNGMYLQPSNSAAHASTSAVMSGANPAARPQSGQKMRPKKSFWGLGSASEDIQGRKLNKKASAMW